MATQGGDEGILLAVTESPDLIVIDTDVPVINGWQAISILKASTVTQTIPVIALTIPTTANKWNRILESGCDACELKPVDLASILAKVKALLYQTSNVAFPAAPGKSTGANLLLFPKPPSITIANRAVDQTDLHDAIVVYVDDSPIDSRTMAAIIQRAGYRYNNISKPLEAISLLLEIKPQLIFLDLVMPYTNGYEVCAQIRRTSTLQKTPVVILTNNDGIIDRVRARIVGASGFLSKPIREKRVVRVLQKYLEADSSSSIQKRKFTLV